MHHPLRTYRCAVALSTMLCAACGGGSDAATIHAESLSTTRFHANLRGSEEVPPVDTTAHGQVLVNASSETELSYRLIVANIDDVISAHIHCAPEGSNGPVGVTLFSGGPVSRNGILVEATITASDSGNACRWEDVADVIDAIMTGNAYVNVHTLAQPGGAIRGQLR